MYLCLRSLLDLEKRVIDFGAAQGWYDLVPNVKPDQMLGLEKNPYAAELARTALWIGYIQWHQANGFPYNNEPILTPLDTIQQTDAILDLSDPDNPKEPEWPAAEFIVGNPPFLGQAMMRDRLGGEYTSIIYDIYSGRLPRTSDLCCYWFEKANGQIANAKTRRAGLLGTQAIRGGANRAVLGRIKEAGGIFMAYPDKPWILDGAMVHISIVGFDNGSEQELTLNGELVNDEILSDLTVGVDVTLAHRLPENRGISFRRQGSVNRFDVDYHTAISMSRLCTIKRHRLACRASCGTRGAGLLSIRARARTA